MELAIETDIYEPSINEDGIYMDYLPPTSKFKNGLRCPCGSRKEQFDNKQNFAIHIKTKIHTKWLQMLNSNSKNFYIDNAILKETITNQKIIIARYDKDLHRLQKENNELIKTINDISNLTKKIILDKDIDLLTF